MAQGERGSVLERGRPVPLLDEVDIGPEVREFAPKLHFRRFPKAPQAPHL
jgi:hypothetical protein